jgi:Tfp pilus assembly protein PilO
VTKLEQRIYSAMLGAHRQYLAMTGYWLSHAPESYITVMIARAIVGLGYNVYIDTSLKKILNDQIILQRSRKRKLSPSLSKRSDISVVFKSKQQTLAAIEVKRAAYYVDPILRDTNKLDRLVGVEGGAKTGT